MDYYIKTENRSRKKIEKNSHDYFFLYHKFGTEDIVRNKFLIDLVNRYEKYKFQNGI
jgi:hypothetical protein